MPLLMHRKLNCVYKISPSTFIVPSTLSFFLHRSRITEASGHQFVGLAVGGVLEVSQRLLNTSFWFVEKSWLALSRSASLTRPCP